MSEGLNPKIAALEDSIKAHMAATATDELHGQSFKITWKPVTTSRIDSKALKAEAPALWERFSKQTTTRRFIVA